MLHRRLFAHGLAVLFFAAVLGALPLSPAPSVVGGVSAANAQEQGRVPGNVLGNTSDSEFWREIRKGRSGSVSIPDKKSAVLVQSEGESWRAFRNGPLSVWGAWALLGIVALLALFFAVRGRIKVDAGLSGRTVERFNDLERFSHWLAAISFIVLGLTGLNLMYGRYILIPVMGAEAFAWMTAMGKYAHNYVAFAFMISLIFLFVLWVKDNVPSKLDLQWIKAGGGLFTKGVHPPARKFNAGQKILFWLVLLGGISVSLSGLSLLFPFKFALFDWTFAVLNAIGFDLPHPLGPVQEMQLSQIWHAIVGLGLIVLIIAHIYIGTLGMVGAFDAMGTGMVDENWAKQHHPLWAEEARQGADAATQKAPPSTAPAAGE